MKSILIILAHAAAGWILCGFTMGAGMALMPLTAALVVHAFAAPLIFAFVARVYFRRFRFTTPLQTAIVFLGFVMLADVVVVAAVIEKSLDMFKSVLGTWLPFLLIFLATWKTGAITKP
jgi:hypothetical protein